LSAYSATGNWSLAHGLIRYALSKALLVAASIAAVGVSIVLYFTQSADHELSISLCIGLATIPLVAFYALSSAATRAFGGVISAVAPERLGRDGITIVLVLLVWALQLTTINASTIMAALFLSSATTASIAWLNFRRLRPQEIDRARPTYEPHIWWRLAFPVMVMIALEILMNRAGLIVLGWSGDTKSAGLFALGLNLALFLILPRLAVGTFFSPNVSKLHTQGNVGALQALYARACLLTLAGTILLAAPLIALTAPLLRFFGNDFVAAAPIVKILVVGQVIAAAAGPQISLMTMTGHERAAATIMMSGAIFGLISAFLGLAYAGMLGVAVAAAGTNAIWTVAMGFCIFSRLKLRPGLIDSLTNISRTCGALYGFKH
jgi:O-antigen/teichoic acid export membrane protein